MRFFRRATHRLLSPSGGSPSSSIPKMRVNRLTLSFEGELEDRFKEDYYASSIGLMRLSFLFGVLYYVSFSALDWMVLPRSALELAMVRLLLVCPVVLGIFFLSFTKSFKRWWQLGAVIATLFSGVGIVIMTIITPDLGRTHYYPGVMLVLFYCYMLIRLRFIWSLLTGWILFSSVLIATLVFSNVDPRILTINIFFIASANLLGMFGGYALEYYSRKDFFFRHLLKKETLKVEEANTALEQKVKEKTKELYHAQKMEAVGRLAGGVAHDFNNMLTVIMGYTELSLKKADQVSGLKEHLGQVLNAAKRSKDITKQLLAFARKQAIEPEILDLNEAIAGMLKMLRRLLGESIELVWKPGNPLSPVSMDPAQLNQLIMNLCVNSRDAISDNGTITISSRDLSLSQADCSGRPGLKPGDYAAISLRDNGHGMDTKTLENIFEPFFTTKTKDKGTGLGLSTVYGIVKQNKGYIEVKSEVGKGTEFVIFFPQETQKKHRPSSSENPSARSSLEASGERVLLVEDEVQILKMSKRVLADLGYHVLAAKSPKEGLRIAQEMEGRLDLLITDVVMPEMNGRILSQKIQRCHPETKVLFMSGYTGEVIAHSGVLDEGVNFLSKPFSNEQLAKRVREVLDTSSG